MAKTGATRCYLFAFKHTNVRNPRFEHAGLAFLIAERYYIRAATNDLKEVMFRGI
jgi:hypothetical protein